MADVPVYDNFNYTVVSVDQEVKRDGTTYEMAYAVVNKETKQVEFISPMLPEAIHQAVACDVAMQTESWLWQYTRMAKEEEETPPPGEKVDGYIQ